MKEAMKSHSADEQMFWQLSGCLGARKTLISGSKHK